TKEMMFKGYTTGAVDYLMKPIVANILRAKVDVFVQLAIVRQKLQEEIAERVRASHEISALNIALEKRNDELVAANADLEAFSYSVSHDLRAPLRHIRGFIGILKGTAETKLDAKERNHFANIDSAAERMSKLVDD